jgi:hypothetical protein
MTIIETATAPQAQRSDLLLDVKDLASPLKPRTGM